MDLKQIKYNALHHQRSDNYVWFLITLSILFLFPLFTLLLPIPQHILFDVLFSITIFVGAYVVTTTQQHLFIGYLLGFIAFALYWWDFATQNTGIRCLQILSSLVFFSYIAYHLALTLIKRTEITLNLICASVVGYLIIGIVGAQLCMLLHILEPEAFKIEMLGKGGYDYFYFSLVTLTTVGYGDITPITQAAKSLALLISIFGQLYLTILIAILVGKYTAK